MTQFTITHTGIHTYIHILAILSLALQATFLTPLILHVLVFYARIVRPTSRGYFRKYLPTIGQDKFLTYLNINVNENSKHMLFNCPRFR